MADETVGHYNIVEKLGEGGMGIVFKARDVRLHRFVALKFLPPDLTESPERVARFEQEARAISALNHPNVATIHAMDEVKGRRFLVLEYLPGGTLRERLRDLRNAGEKLPVGDAIHVALQVAEGLAHAHRAGIIHRDIKGDNIMFTADGTARITDFGLAKSFSRAEITRDGTTVGTVAYMSPEQATGETVDSRSDLFSLGVLLYEMLAGTRPFQAANDMATLHAVITKEPAPLIGFRPEVSPAIQRIVSKLLEKEREQRYQRAEDVARDLRAVRTGGEPSTEQTAQITELPTASMPMITRAKSAAPAAIRRTGRWKWIATGAVVCVVAALLFLKWFSGDSLPADRHLAILGFTSVDPGVSQAMCDGLTLFVAGGLEHLPQQGNRLWVVRPGDVRAQKVKSPAEARALFGATLALSGTVERSGLRLKLIDTQRGKVLRETVLPRPDGSFAILQESSVSALRRMLDLRSDADARDSKTSVASAYDLYLQASGYLQRYDQDGNVERAINFFERAITRDDSYALAHAGLSQAYFRKYSMTREPHWLELARGSAEQAISRNANLDAPHITLASIALATDQVPAAIAQCQKALELDPVNSDAFRELAKAYAAQGRVSEAERTYQRAIQLRPDYWMARNDLAVFYTRRGRYADAEKALLEAIRLTPDNQLNYRNLGGVYAHMGRYEDAERALRKSIELGATGSAFSNLGTVYMYLGRFEDAVPIMEKAIVLDSGDRANSYIAWGNLGDAYRWSKSQSAKAPEAYRKAIELGEAQLAVNPNGAVLLGRLASYHAKLGERAQARDALDRAKRILPNDPSVLHDSVFVYELEGNRSGAIAALSAALKAGYSEDAFQADRYFTLLRQDPRYEKVIRASTK